MCGFTPFNISNAYYFIIKMKLKTLITSYVK